MVMHYRVLLEHIHSLRDSKRFDRFENETKSVAPGLDYDDENKRAKKRKLFYDETPEEVKVSDCRENFRVNTYLVFIDRLLSKIKKRKTAYTNVYERFGVLTEIRSLANSDITSKCEQLTRYYGNDIEPDFEKEFRLFTKYGDFKTGAEMITFLRENKLITSFPNVEIALRIFL